MIDVDISDPDGDFEIMSETPINSNQKPTRFESPHNPKSLGNRDAEIIDTLMKMYDQGLISDDQLLDMVEKVENGEDVKAIEEITTIRAQSLKPTYQPPTFATHQTATLPSVRPSAMATIGTKLPDFLTCYLFYFAH